jgi:hypothetical protein
LIPSVVPEFNTISSSSAAPEEARDDAAHRLVFLGGEVREEVQPAMHVGVFLGIGRVTASITTCGFCAEAPLSR